LSNRVDARYWTGFFAFSAAMLAYFHISPWAVEPPQDVMVPYESVLAGSVAFAIVLALIASTVVGSIYGVILWARGSHD
jgi:hypothetical protein